MFKDSAFEFLWLRWENISGILEQSIFDYIFSQMSSVFKDHLFSTYAKFPKHWHFLATDTYASVCVSGGKKCYFLGKFCSRTKWMIPYRMISCINIISCISLSHFRTMFYFFIRENFNVIFYRCIETWLGGYLREFSRSFIST